MNHPISQSVATLLRGCLKLLGIGCVFLIPVVESRAVPVTSAGSLTGSISIIDYSSSPVGTLAGGTSITTQYSSLGVIHDGSTTTPPGPPGIGSFSGLPGLESPAGDPDPLLPISIFFSTSVSQVGAFFLMGSSTASMTLSAYRADSSLIESYTYAAGAMTFGSFGFHEGFVGLILAEDAAKVVFAPSHAAFVIDDLHFGVPDGGSTIALLVLGMLGLAGAKRKFAD